MIRFAQLPLSQIEVSRFHFTQLPDERTTHLDRMLPIYLDAFFENLSGPKRRDRTNNSFEMRGLASSK
jgi:hypothetical protein